MSEVESAVVLVFDLLLQLSIFCCCCSNCESRMTTLHFTLHITDHFLCLLRKGSDNQMKCWMDVNVVHETVIKIICMLLIGREVLTLICTMLYDDVTIFVVY